MIEVYWYCPMCNLAGKIVHQFSQSTPIDPTKQEIVSAIDSARQKIRMTHATEGCPGVVVVTFPVVETRHRIT